MPSYCIHLAIGNLYAKKNKIEDKAAFDAGVIAPDFSQDKEKSHYSAPRDKRFLLDFLHKKVRLAEYLKNNEIDSDYKRGEFLHLVTDYLYFNHFFSEAEIEARGADFMPTMYYSYDLIKEYVEKKYEVVYPGDLAAVMQAIEDKRKLLGFDKGVQKDNILPVEKLDRFIEFCANVDLVRYQQEVVAAGKNVFLSEAQAEW